MLPLLGMVQCMSLQVASISIGFTTELANKYLLSIMDQFMSYQGASLSRGLFTKIADMLPLLGMDQSMSLQVTSLSIGFTTVLANMFLLPTMDLTCFIKVPVSVEVCPHKLQTCCGGCHEITVSSPKNI